MDIEYIRVDISNFEPHSLLAVQGHFDIVPVTSLPILGPGPEGGAFHDEGGARGHGEGSRASESVIEERERVT